MTASPQPTTCSTRRASQRSLFLALWLIAGYALVEVVGGLWSGSLALLADAAHEALDAVSIALALIAMRLAERAATARFTYGYRRLEILAALVNALTLWLIVGWILHEAWQRLHTVPEIQGVAVLLVGTFGLLINIAVAWILHREAVHSVNVDGAFQHVLADLLGSVGVLVSGGLILGFGWMLADPLVTVFISILILRSAWRLLAKVVHVLLEGTPAHIDVRQLCMQLEAMEGVAQVHDIHVWTISPGSEALTGHIVMVPGYPSPDALLHAVRERIQADYGIDHLTIQLERSDGDCPDRHDVAARNS